MKDPYFTLLSEKEQLHWCQFGVGPKENPTAEEKIEFERIDKIMRDEIERRKAKENLFFLEAADVFERVAEMETDEIRKAKLLESVLSLREGR
jgi:hypothetical protein